MIIPSIDIMEGRAVQLRQGREHVLTDTVDPRELAARFGRFGPVAVVDLDAALGRGHNRDVVAACCRAARCRVGGGVRSEDDVRYWIKQGAEKVMIGTRATPEFMRQFPREWLIAALDARGDEVVVNGWTQRSGQRVGERARALEPYCSEFLYTQVEREGMLGGADLSGAAALQRTVSTPLVIAGGFASLSEVSTAVDMGLSVQLGRAIYEGDIDLADAWAAQVRFNDQGLVPTIVQDVRTRDVLMLAYSNAESLRLALEQGQGWYWSRSRSELWRKGGTSGNTQQLVRAAWDCDRDAILFLVEQRGPACHLDRSNCFAIGGGGVMDRLASTIRARAASAPGRSYTRRLLDEPGLVAAKLREEIEEVIEAESNDDLAWESADVLYHLMVRAAAGGVPWSRVVDELRSRFSPA